LRRPKAETYGLIIDKLEESQQVIKLRFEEDLLEWSQKVIVRSESDKHGVVGSLLSAVYGGVRCEGVAS